MPSAPGRLVEPGKLGEDAVRIRHHRPFLFYWFARVCGSLALQMQAVAVGWQVYDLTHSALDLGLVGLVQFLPIALFLLPAGHFADIYSRKLIAAFSLFIQAACAATLALGTLQGWISREVIFAVVFALGTARAFEAPTSQALLPGIVSAAMLPRAVGAAASAMQVAMIVGPAAGGFLYAVSPAVVYATCSTLFLSAGILTGLLNPNRVGGPRQPFSLAAIFAGISFVRRNQIILGAISLDLFAVLFGGATALLPIFARDIFAIGPWGLGLLRAAPALGAITMALFLMRHPPRRRVGHKMFLAVAIYGLATIVFALSSSLWLSLFALAMTGAADMVSVVIRQTLVQLWTPDEMRGRVSAVNAMFIGTSSQLGEFESGVTAALFGTVASVLIGGIGSVLVVLLWMRAFPQLRDADKLENPFAVSRR